MASELARRLRRNQTDEEKIVWSELRKKRLGGMRFRRQHPIGPYIVDFVCLEERMIVEIDGVHHAEAAVAKHDDDRCKWLQGQGYRTLRITNGEVRENLNGVLDTLLGELGLLQNTSFAPHPHPDPPPSRGRARGLDARLRRP